MVKITFFSVNSDDPGEQAFNIAHTKGRQPVEGTFGRAKNKWRILLRGGGGMRYVYYNSFYGKDVFI